MWQQAPAKPKKSASTKAAAPKEPEKTEKNKKKKAAEPTEDGHDSEAEVFKSARSKKARNPPAVSQGPQTSAEVEKVLW